MEITPSLEVQTARVANDSLPQASLLGLPTELIHMIADEVNRSSPWDHSQLRSTSRRLSAICKSQPYEIALLRTPEAIARLLRPKAPLPPGSAAIPYESIRSIVYLGRDCIMKSNLDSVEYTKFPAVIELSLHHSMNVSWRDDDLEPGQRPDSRPYPRLSQLRDGMRHRLAEYSRHDAMETLLTESPFTFRIYCEGAGGPYRMAELGVSVVKAAPLPDDLIPSYLYSHYYTLYLPKEWDGSKESFYPSDRSPTNYEINLQWTLEGTLARAGLLATHFPPSHVSSTLTLRGKWSKEQGRKLAIEALPNLIAAQQGNQARRCHLGIYQTTIGLDSVVDNCIRFSVSYELYKE